MSDAASILERRSSLAHATAAVLAGRGQPATWSMIMTLYGDVVLPHGGAIPTARLIEIMGPLGYGDGVLRTALSRLVADGWLESTRLGRRSEHALTAQGRAASSAAAARIYRVEPLPWDGRLEVAVITAEPTDERARLRKVLTGAGFGMAGAETAIRPAGRPEAVDCAELAAGGGVVVITGPTTPPGRARELAVRAFELDRLAEQYGRLETHLAPLLDAVARAGELDPADALAARLVLIHEYRRVILRDHDLPTALLPVPWPGHVVRRRIAAAYRELVASSERAIAAIAPELAEVGRSEAGSVTARFTEP